MIKHLTVITKSMLLDNDRSDPIKSVFNQMFLFVIFELIGRLLNKCVGSGWHPWSPRDSARYRCVGCTVGQCLVAEYSNTTTRSWTS